jgi:ABC-type Fe3+ transport system substrate-binding protein
MAAENAAVIVIGHASTMSIDQLSRILRLVEKRPSALDSRIVSSMLTMDSWQQQDKLLALRRAALTVLLNQVEAQLNG